MGDPMYTRDQENPDQVDRAVDGITKSIAAPGDAVRRNIVPVANYVYTGAIWVPESVGGGLIWVLQTIAQYAEDSTGTLEGTIAGLLNEMARGGTIMPGALSPPVVSARDQDIVKQFGNWQGVPYGNDIGSIEAMVGRKYLAVDAGAYVSPAVANGGTAANPITFTGVLLLGRISYIFNVTDRTFHRAVTVVDPAGGAVGTIVCDPPLRTASSVLRIRYASVPHSWNSATDATQTLAVAGDPPRVNGPATFISETTAKDNGSYQWILPCANYGRWGFEIIWTANGGTARTVAWHAFGKINDAAWAAPGAIPAVYNIDTLIQTTAGSTAWGAAAGSGAIEGRLVDPGPFNSVCFEALVAADDANTTTITAWITLYGGTK